jgi:hypothetical protein
MSSIVARVERIRSGHSDRALVHAIDAEGREYKIEVPLDDVRELPSDQAYLLVMSWSIHASPVPGTAVVSASAPASTPRPPVSPVTSAPSSVDAQFMALMNHETDPHRTLDKYSDNKRGELPRVLAGAPSSPPESTPDQQLASMLGMPRDSKPTT